MESLHVERRIRRSLARTREFTRIFSNIVLTLPRRWVQLGIPSLRCLSTLFYVSVWPLDTTTLIPPCEEKKSEDSWSEPTLSASPTQLAGGVASFSNNMTATLDELDSEIDKSLTLLKRKLAEAVFVECFVVHNRCHGFLRSASDEPSGYFPMGLDAKIDHYIPPNADLPKLICESYARIAAMGALGKQRQQSENIVYFNVDGECLCALRSSIMSVLFQSQLAIRVSGDWQEQEDTLDDQGRLIVEFRLNIFKPLLDYVRIAGMLGVGLVKKEIHVCRTDLIPAAKQMLDYFAIDNLAVVE